MQIAQRWVLFRLRNRVFFDLSELNAELRRLTQEMNEHPFKRIGGSRTTRFEVEQPALKQLTAADFELCDWRYGVRVGRDYHVEHGRSRYSVPCALGGARVDLRFTARTLEVMHGGKRVAVHAVSTSPESVTTVPEHLPPSHLHVLQGEPKALTTWAEGVGPSTIKMVRHHLQDRSDAANGLRAAHKLRDLARLHGVTCPLPAVPT